MTAADSVEQRGVSEILTIPAEEFTALRGHRHCDPHRILGAHPVFREGGDGAEKGVVVRAFHPMACRVECLLLDKSGAAECLAMKFTGQAGLFALYLPGVPLPLAYRLRFHFLDGTQSEFEDPYRFLPTLGDHDLHFLGEGTHRRLWEVLGAHHRIEEGVSGVSFAVWAPNALGVSVVGDFSHWDGRIFPMRSLGGSGVFELFIPGIEVGARYKFEVQCDDGKNRMKADPIARWAEHPPRTASRVEASSYQWQDEAWMEARPTREPQREAMAAYEVHLGSWARVPEEGRRPLGYREIAPKLIAHLKRFGFTHLEFMPISEYPFDGSWGYQVSGYFAPTSRFGTPDDLRFLIDQCHLNGIGVIMDWVPAHFPRDDFALRLFDGTPLYEHADPRLGEHPDWGTLIFNYRRNEVKNFLIASAIYWLDQFHLDGLRVDGVASMLYLDYSRDDKEWLPNEHGGRENLAAVELLRDLNQTIRAEYPGCITIAEESTSWEGVTADTRDGGLGFTFKWNMGWMNDTLAYFSRDPVHRSHHQGDLTFAMIYEYSERFVMPLSHDEVVHGKGSLLDKMPGDAWQKFANLRLLLSYQYTRPGKKLLFMGTEIAPDREWDHLSSLPWHLCEDPVRVGFATFMEQLGALYRDSPCFWEADSEPHGFEWIDTGDSQNCVLVYLRRGTFRPGEWCRGSSPSVIVVLNLTPIPRDGYRIGVPEMGRYVERFCSDDASYGGSGYQTSGSVESERIASHGRRYSIELRLPPLCAVVLERAPGLALEDGAGRSHLCEIAERCGILAGYEDTAGCWHTTSAASAERLLAAMGIDASDEARAAQALAEIDQRESCQLLEPVRVVRQGSDEATSVTLRIGEVPSSQAITWHLQLIEESGRVREARGSDRCQRGALRIPIPDPETLAPGYHKLVWRGSTGAGEVYAAEQSYILAPRKCLTPDEVLGSDRGFVITSNLYTIRSENGWGIGNLSDLRALLGWAAEVGAAGIGINPLHARENRGEGISPYYPISRLFRDLLYLDVPAIPEFADCAEVEQICRSAAFQEAIERHRAAQLIDYPAIFDLVRSVLAPLHQHFVRTRTDGSERHRAYDAFVEQGGAALRDYATFLALHDHFAAAGAGVEGGGCDWRHWPLGYEHPGAKAVREFASIHGEDLGFHCYVQFEIERQLRLAHAQAADGGLPIGILGDLAVGSSPGGSDTWSFPGLFAGAATLGAPPDSLAPQGQDWDLSPVDPQRLAQDGYRFWTLLLRSAFQCVGALRIDHVMGLARQFWIPHGDPEATDSPIEGAYVQYPDQALLGILALESRRAGAIVIGEDLGTLPRGFREMMEDWGVQRTQVLYFERSVDGSFQAPGDYSRNAFATVNTHDVATLTGFLRGVDHRTRRELGLLSGQEFEQAKRQRACELQHLQEALAAHVVNCPAWDTMSPADLCLAVSAFLAASPSFLVGVSLDDLGLEEEAVNIPGLSAADHPVWSRRMRSSLTELRRGELIQRLLEVFTARGSRRRSRRS